MNKAFEQEDEKGTGGLWDKAGEIAVQIGLEFKKSNPNLIPDGEPVYAEDFGQEIIYYALKEVMKVWFY